jgi:hypothetical protein
MRLPIFEGVNQQSRDLGVQWIAFAPLAAWLHGLPSLRSIMRLAM